ncbi:hypothetical protein ABZP36_011715 [Zizania latifolia]
MYLFCFTIPDNACLPATGQMLHHFALTLCPQDVLTCSFAPGAAGLQCCRHSSCSLQYFATVSATMLLQHPPWHMLPSYNLVGTLSVHCSSHNDSDKGKYIVQQQRLN